MDTKTTLLVGITCTLYGRFTAGNACYQCGPIAIIVISRDSNYNLDFWEKHFIPSMNIYKYREKQGGGEYKSLLHIPSVKVHLFYYLIG